MSRTPPSYPIPIQAPRVSLWASPEGNAVMSGVINRRLLGLLCAIATLMTIAGSVQLAASREQAQPPSTATAAPATGADAKAAQQATP